MERAIKFRAWDKKNEQMHSAKDLGLWDYYINPETGKVFLFEDASQPFSDLMKMTELPDFELMQFTGLLDKNGKEIYEGDIVKLSYGIPPTSERLVIEWTDNGEFKDFYVSGWWMKNIRKNGISVSLHKEYVNDLEVIGNIYENPELK